MPTMRNGSLRSKVNTRVRKESSSTDKLRAIRALYIVVYNGEESILPCATELFHSIGDILEGVPLNQLDLHRVSKQQVLDTYAELSDT